MLDRNPWLVAMVLGGLGVAHTRATIIPRRQVSGKTALQSGGSGSILTGLWHDLGHL